MAIGFNKTTRVFGSLMLAVACVASSASAFAGVDWKFFQSVGRRNPEIPPMALKGAYLWLKNRGNTFKNQNYVTIVDFTKSSSQQRLFIIDMNRGYVSKLLVSHGQGSGESYATSFDEANRGRTESHKSEIGAFRTFGENEWDSVNEDRGVYGRTRRLYRGGRWITLPFHRLRLEGLDNTNQNTQSRIVVLHEAGVPNGDDERNPYVSWDYVAKRGQAGRSYGCFVLDPMAVEGVIERIKGSSLLYAYHPKLDAEIRAMDR